MEPASDVVLLQLPRVFLYLGVDDFDELWLERRSAHEETIDVLLGGELLAGSTSN